MVSLTQLADFHDCGMAVDLGTTTTLIFVRGRGIVLAEPSLVAVRRGTRNVRAVGIAAEQLLDQDAGSVTGVRPLRSGVIADLELATKMIKRFIRMACRGRRSHPRLVVGVPVGATELEREGVREACLAAGASDALLIEEPLAAATGAGLPVADAVGSLVVDIGGGMTEVASISLGEAVVSQSIEVGGNAFDKAIVKYLTGEHGLLVSQPTAEQLKRGIGSAFPTDRVHRAEVRGRDSRTGRPTSSVVTSEDVRRALDGKVKQIVDAVKDTLARTPPELASDIFERGTVLAGGGALLDGLEERLREETQMPAQVAALPLTCVVAGAGVWLKEMNHGRFEEAARSRQ
jgi:rod shape-determining protein MreB